MIKVLVLFGAPRDVAAFDAHFDHIHRGLLGALPHVEHVSVNRVEKSMQGKPPYRLIVELRFPSEEAMQEGLNAEEGQAMARDFQSFASGGVTILFCHSDPGTLVRSEPSPSG
jgi:uncharacterized protein (TIGR02118 family)